MKRPRGFSGAMGEQIELLGPVVEGDARWVLFFKIHELFAAVGTRTHFSKFPGDQLAGL